MWICFIVIFVRLLSLTLAFVSFCFCFDRDRFRSGSLKFCSLSLRLLQTWADATQMGNQPPSVRATHGQCIYGNPYSHVCRQALGSLAQSNSGPIDCFEYLRTVLSDPSLTTYWGTLMPEMVVAVLSGTPTTEPSQGWVAVTSEWSQFVSEGASGPRSKGG